MVVIWLQSQQHRVEGGQKFKVILSYMLQVKFEASLGYMIHLHYKKEKQKQQIYNILYF